MHNVLYQIREGGDRGGTTMNFEFLSQNHRQIHRQSPSGMGEAGWGRGSNSGYTKKKFSN